MSGNKFSNMNENKIFKSYRICFFSIFVMDWFKITPIIFNAFLLAFFIFAAILFLRSTNDFMIQVIF